MPKVTSNGKKVTGLTFDEKQMIWLALTYRANLIETGDPTLSAVDVRDGHNGNINPLDIEQMKTLVFINDLKERINAASD